MVIRRKRATARRREAPRFTSEDWQAINLTLLLRTGGVCWWCNCTLDGVGARHHRQRRRDGGDRLCNLVLIHPNCHNVHMGSVHQEPALATMQGFIVPSWADPFTYPILVRNRWVTLDDEGGLHDASPPG